MRSCARLEELRALMGLAWRNLAFQFQKIAPSRPTSGCKRSIPIFMPVAMLRDHTNSRMWRDIRGGMHQSTHYSAG